jgi:bifunctional non-homologous end joining protein LigD
MSAKAKKNSTSPSTICPASFPWCSSARWKSTPGTARPPTSSIPINSSFDLDPGPDLSWKRLIEGARILNRNACSLHLPTFLKTSGGKGLHITIPIEPNVDWDSAKSFCETIAKSLAEKSDIFVANMRKDLRGGKVYIDYNRNGRSATAVAPYSTRARAGAPVSMPISWDELGKLKSADQFTVDSVGRYLAKRKSRPLA